MPERRFAIFVLAYRRPEKMSTIHALDNAGWDGPTYIVLGSDDPTADEYRRRFGAERVLVFSKEEVPPFDLGFNQPDLRTSAYARNAIYGIAAGLGLTHFLVLDDDYTIFLFRSLATERSPRGGYRGEPHGLILSSPIVKRTFRRVIDATLDLLEVSGAVTIGWSQGGDHMGGVEGDLKHGMRRKAMNAFFLRTDRPVRFIGRMNEDVNTYIVGGSRGDIFLTVLGVQFNQLPSQQTPGGLTEVYLATGTYVKTFYTVMMAPSCVKVGMLGRTDFRFHHSITWDHAVPKIISSKYRKAA